MPCTIQHCRERRLFEPLHFIIPGGLEGNRTKLGYLGRTFHFIVWLHNRSAGDNMMGHSFGVAFSGGLYCSLGAIGLHGIHYVLFYCHLPHSFSFSYHVHIVRDAWSAFITPLLVTDFLPLVRYSLGWRFARLLWASGCDKL